MYYKTLHANEDSRDQGRARARRIRTRSRTPRRGERNQEAESIQPVLLQLLAQGAPIDTEHLRRLGPTPAAPVEHHREQGLLDFTHHEWEEIPALMPVERVEVAPERVTYAVFEANLSVSHRRGECGVDLQRRNRARVAGVPAHASVSLRP